MEIYSKDKEMTKALEKFFKDYPICAFSKLVNKSIIASLNHNQWEYAEDGDRFYEYIDKNILNTKRINNDYNWKNLTTIKIDGKKDYIYPAEYFRNLVLKKYAK